MEDGFYKGLLDSLSEGVYFLDLDRNVTYWNKAAERLSGYSAKEMIGKSCSDHVLRHVDCNGTELCLNGCPMLATMQEGKEQEASVFMHHKFGHRVPVLVRASPMRDSTGKIVGAVEIFSDNGENLDILKEIEELRKEILTDQLTGIGNRRYADISMERLDQTMQENSVPFGVLFVDIDHFKNVNDTWGHHVGDMVLAMVAQTLRSVLRPLDVACRWGGEEFVIFIANTTIEKMAVIAERLRMLIEHSWVEQEDDRIKVTASIGGALSANGERAESVVEKADNQLYLSKESGRNCTHINDVKYEAK
ncbi:diguanylate cyclase [Pseudodesulfovibrio nedwellii]|uniref:Diguanylate cyclase n=1 Tax=Pseudodesulfovibrio nedwellii TaxID=2973072 RepID=A0ABM8B1K2_9BACT|nr:MULTISPECIES: diguanylate cyclase [Pseudodesulfovibrio]BDQ37627.1 diguanylate cyclase [Pseudodesulfovibrio nedwellii]